MALYPFQQYNWRFREGAGRMAMSWWAQIYQWLKTLTEEGVNIRLNIWSSVVSRINSSMRWRLRQQRGFGKRRLLEGCSTAVNRKRSGGMMRTQFLQQLPVKVSKYTCYIQMSGNEWEEWWALSSWASPPKIIVTEIQALSLTWNWTSFLVESCSFSTIISVQLMD